MKKIDESNIGIWLWIVLILGIVATVVVMDLWLHRHGHEYLTTEFKEGLRSPVWGAVLVFLTAGTISALVWHFFSTPGKP
ncbi:MAG: hypothetical protein QOF30_780 [Acidimicrobiaceae bacterium]|nr:hypothetical protein [Acidimicrobiaceae bacterium]